MGAKKAKFCGRPLKTLPKISKSPSLPSSTLSSRVSKNSFASSFFLPENLSTSRNSFSTSFRVTAGRRLHEVCSRLSGTSVLRARCCGGSLYASSSSGGGRPPWHQGGDGIIRYSVWLVACERGARGCQCKSSLESVCVLASHVCRCSGVRGPLLLVHFERGAATGTGAT